MFSAADCRRHVKFRETRNLGKWRSLQFQWRVCPSALDM